MERGTYSHDGGALTNQGIHYIDMLIFFAKNITEVSCIAKTLGSKIEVEDTATAIFKLKNGGIGSLEITTAARPDDFEGSVTLVCSKGMAKISGIASNELVIFFLQIKKIVKNILMILRIYLVEEKFMEEVITKHI